MEFCIIGVDRSALTACAMESDKAESKQKLIREIGNQMIVGASGGALIGNMFVGVPGAVAGAVVGATIGLWQDRNSS